MAGGPHFFDHCDVRFVGPPFPFSGAASANVAAWARLHEPAPVDARVAAFLLDIMPPATSATFGKPRPMASIDFTVHFFDRFERPDEAARDYHLVSIASRWADDGYTEELRDLWTRGAALLAQCRQNMALI